MDRKSGANFKCDSFPCGLLSDNAYLVMLSNSSYTRFYVVKYFSQISLT